MAGARSPRRWGWGIPLGKRPDAQPQIKISKSFGGSKPFCSSHAVVNSITVQAELLPPELESGNSQNLYSASEGPHHEALRSPEESPDWTFAR